MSKQPTAVIYLRVSTKEQAERGGDGEGFSIPAQREACRGKAEALGAVVIEEFVDRGESAHSRARPELERMLGHLIEEPATYVIVHKTGTGSHETELTTSRSTSSSRRSAPPSSATPRASTKLRAASCCTAS
ncbi:MAG: recombinase family protein [bacterium]|nr:recombinase family protein [bacterium]MCP5030289.1 recombinase family protein [Actinomycetes bacterium]